MSPLPFYVRDPDPSVTQNTSVSFYVTRPLKRTKRDVYLVTESARETSLPLTLSGPWAEGTLLRARGIEGRDAVEWTGAPGSSSSPKQHSDCGVGRRRALHGGSGAPAPCGPEGRPVRSRRSGACVGTWGCGRSLAAGRAGALEGRGFGSGGFGSRARGGEGGWDAALGVGAWRGAPTDSEVWRTRRRPSLSVGVQ